MLEGLEIKETDAKRKNNQTIAESTSEEYVSASLRLNNFAVKYIFRY